MSREGSTEDDALEMALEDFLERRRRGEAVSISDFARGRPELSRLRSLLPALLAVEQAARGDSETVAPEVLGDFVLRGELGRGGMGIVYAAERRSDGQRVALKVMASGVLLDAKMRQRFRREAMVAARLDHPGLCRVLDAGVDGDVPFIAMDFIEGSTLAKTIAAASQEVFLDVYSDEPPSREAAGPGDVAWSVALIEEVARALDVAHQASIVHRDIKPSNVMITPSGSPVVLDFGLASDPGNELTGLTVTGDVIGTPAYMSPEQIRGRGAPLDPRTDVYSLGVTLFECLTLRRPFRAPTRDALYRAILDDDPPSLRSIDPKIPRDLEIIVETAMDKRRDRRYRSAGHLAEDLRRLRQAERINARALTPLDRLIRWATTHPARAALVVVLMVGLPVVASLATYIWSTRESVMTGERELLRRETDRGLVRGFGAVGDRRLDRARAAFERVLDANPRCAEAVAGLAIVCLEENDAAGAVEHLETHASVVSEHNALQDIFALALDKDGQHERARTVAEATEAHVSATDFFILGQQWISRAQSGTPDAWREAYSAFTQAVLRSDRAFAMHHYYRLFAAGQVGDSALVHEATAPIVRWWGSDGSSWVWIGRARSAVHDLAGAARAFERAVDLAPDDGYAHANLAITRARIGDAPGALAAARRAVELSGEEYESFYALALAHRVRGEGEQAVAALRRGLELEPDSLDLLAELGHMLAVSGDLAAAEIHLDRALTINPRFARAHFGRGVVHFERGDFARAAESFTTFVQLRPESVAGHHGLARCLVRLDRTREAHDHLVEAVRLAPNDGGLETALGRARVMLARKAALGAAGRGGGPEDAEPDEPAALRAKARDWLRSALEALRKGVESSPPKRREVLSFVASWQSDDDFAVIRDEPALATYPPDERDACEELWDDVDDVIADLDARDD